jgi:hypothetical protein
VTFRPALAAAVVAAAALAVPAAFADGDPASDVLLVDNTFLPAPPPAPDAQAQLTHAVQVVNAKGDRVKVAVIASANDLGAIPSLFGKPMLYAKFLGLELKYVYSGALLIVMPQGFGFYDGPKAAPTATAALHGLPAAGTTATALTQSAAAAVDRLERAGALHFKDLQPPQVYVIAATGHRGRSVDLRYWGADDSGRAGITASVTRGATVLASFKSPLQKVMPNLVYAFKWRVPPTTPAGEVTFCARAVDAAGHRSGKTCAAVKVT